MNADQQHLGNDYFVCLRKDCGARKLITSFTEGMQHLNLVGHSPESLISYPQFKTLLQHQVSISDRLIGQNKVLEIDIESLRKMEKDVIVMVTNAITKHVDKQIETLTSATTKLKSIQSIYGYIQIDDFACLREITSDLSFFRADEQLEEVIGEYSSVQLLVFEGLNNLKDNVDSFIGYVENLDQDFQEDGTESQLSDHELPRRVIEEFLLPKIEQNIKQNNIHDDWGLIELALEQSSFFSSQELLQITWNKRKQQDVSNQFGQLIKKLMDQHERHQQFRGPYSDGFSSDIPSSEDDEMSVGSEEDENFDYF